MENRKREREGEKLIKNSTNFHFEQNHLEKVVNLCNGVERCI